jgi:hypothetical protein
VVIVGRWSSRVPDRSVYLQQVRRIAPPDPPGLIGRETELEELAQFCVEPVTSPYIWWCAEPWAGKSALLSNFVLYPPRQIADSVRIVSFFVTARLASQDTRDAFAEVLLEQLAVMTGQPVPSALPEALRDAYLLDQLEQAATACLRTGRCLILVIDGLDEDRGTTTGRGARSIAGLLPADPPAGMRVVVAGRSNPPIPDDVPSGHPLRDPAIIRRLSASPHARDVARLAKQELLRLLNGSDGEQDILGMVTAAQGGLSGSDLEELTGTPLWKSEQTLHTVAGRTFTRQGSRWAPATAPDAYLLGHEELQSASASYLGRERLAGYRDRLHQWASSYRDRGWPKETPEYLLSGYYRLLVTVEDLPRVVASAGDAVRHDRMLDLTGGDSSAMTEIRTALDLIGIHDPSDLSSALWLAIHRDQLKQRGACIPLTIPAIWASLGNLIRARGLIASLTTPVDQAVAMAHLTGVLAREGSREAAAAAAAAAVAAETVEVVRSIRYKLLSGDAMAEIAELLAGAGQYERAKELARIAIGSDAQAHCLARIVGALAVNGEYRQAQDMASAITDPWQRAEARALLAHARGAAGEHALAEQLVRSLTVNEQRAPALADLGAALARAGLRTRAAAAFTEAEAAARTITPQYRQATILAQVAEALATAGEHEQALQLAHHITYEKTRVQALTRVAGTLARAGFRAQAAAAFTEAQAAARSITDPKSRAYAVMLIVKKVAETGEHKRAHEMACGITDPSARSEALANLAEELVGAGMHPEAAAIATEAEVVARSITRPTVYDEEAWVRVVEALVSAGKFRLAEEAARSRTSPNIHQGWALGYVAEGLAAAGKFAQAREVARSITSKVDRSQAQAKVAAASTAGNVEQADESACAADRHRSEAPEKIAAALAAGEFRQAEELARSFDSVSLRADVLAQVAVAMGPGQLKQAEELARSNPYSRAGSDGLAHIGEVLAAAGQYSHAEELGRSAVHPNGGPLARARVAEALAAAGQGGQAEQLARSISGPDQRGRALVWVANALALAGQYANAEELARSIAEPDLQAEVLAELAETLAKAGDTRSACRVAVALCAVSPWTTAAPVVLQLDPTASDSVAAALQDRQLRPTATKRNRGKR